MEICISEEMYQFLLSSATKEMKRLSKLYANGHKTKEADDRAWDRFSDAAYFTDCIK